MDIKKHLTYDNFLLIILALIIILPVFQHTSPSRYYNVIIARFEVVFILLSAPYLLLNRKKINFISPFWTAVFCLWCIAVYYSVIQAEHYGPAYLRGIVTIVNAIFAIAVTLYFHLWKGRSSWIMAIVPIGFFISGLAVIHFGVNLTDFNEHCWACTGSFPNYSSIRHLDYHVFGAIIFTFYFLIESKRHHLLVAGSFVLLTYNFSFLLWSGGRGAIIASLTSFFVILTYLSKGERARFIMASLLSLSISYLLLVNLGLDEMTREMVDRSMAYQNYSDLLAGLYNDFLPTLNIISGDRIECCWIPTLEALSHSYLFGLGPESYIYIEPRLFGTQPHNSVLQFLLEWGVVGTLLFLVILSGMFRRGTKYLKSENSPSEKTRRVVLLSLIIGFGVFSLVDGIFYHGLSLMIFSITVAAFSSTQVDPENSSPKNQLSEDPLK